MNSMAASWLVSATRVRASWGRLAAMASMRACERRRRSTTVDVVPASSARCTSLALARRISGARCTRRSAAAWRAASLSPVCAVARRREARLARWPCSAIGVVTESGYRGLRKHNQVVAVDDLVGQALGQVAGARAGHALEHGGAVADEALGEHPARW